MDCAKEPSFRNENSGCENEDTGEGKEKDKTADEEKTPGKSKMSDDEMPTKFSRNQIVLSNRQKSLGI